MKTYVRKIKNRLRQQFPNKLVVSKFEKELVKNRPKVIFMDVPTNGNLGDQALVYAGEKYLQNLFPNLEIIEVANDEINSSLKQFKKNENSFKSIIWNGGGNIGTLYPTAELSRWDAFKKLRKKEFIVFPQSVYFSNDKFGKRFLKKSNYFYTLPEHISVFLREKKSYDFFVKKYAIEKSKVNLVPDIVFSLESKMDIEDGQQREGILTLLRSDKEKGLEDTKHYVNLLKEKGYLVEEGDTFIEGIKVSRSERNKLLKNFWKRMAKKELIVTDRLHGMIFAYLTKTPALVFQNNNWKIRSTYDTWLKDCNFIEMADINKGNFVKQIEYLKKQNTDYLNLSSEFEPLSNVLRSALANGKK
jgi:exopolysaccharide biosynthesis predicted pyruvyltransferase EpsI